LYSRRIWEETRHMAKWVKGKWLRRVMYDSFHVCQLLKRDIT